jgi:hypothetical protein
MSSKLESEYLDWQQRRLQAACKRFRRANQDQPELFDNLYIFSWLQQEVPQQFREAVLKASDCEPDTQATTLLVESNDETKYLQGLISYWLQQPNESHHHREKMKKLLADHGNQLPDAADEMLSKWQKLGIFRNIHIESVRRIQTEQKLIAEEVGGKVDQQRVALVDTLPKRFSPAKPFSKIGLIPGMACAQNCRHCMFVWRTPMKNPPDPAPLFKRLNAETRNILFTGGDLDQRMSELYRAIVEMSDIEVFAILLNGAFATSLGKADKRFMEIRQALKMRPKHFRPAQVTLQISFDEYHQEIKSDKNGNLTERIPVASIANLVARSRHYPEIQFVLLHKQNRLNFSQNLFKVGVFARLSRALSALEHPVADINWQTSPRAKADPINPEKKGGVIRDVLFTIKGYPDHPIHMMSSTIDAYGRAALLDPSEYINERDYLGRILKDGPPPEERFDIDPMVWYDGSVTLFSASHLWMGNLFDEKEKVFLRYRKDPLLDALERFDPALLDYYSKRSNNLKELKKRATGPHHLFHQITESAPMRLHLTQCLIENR